VPVLSFCKVAAKVRSLNDFYARITNGVVPVPTGMDVANTLRHFNQLLLGKFLCPFAIVKIHFFCLFVFEISRFVFKLS
jgi:hypothetical protein